MNYKSQKQRNKPYYVFAFIFSFFVLYGAVAIAPYAQNGLGELLNNFPLISFKFSDLRWTNDTFHTIIICEIIYLMVFVMLMSFQRKTHRNGVEDGSADYADVTKMQKEFNSKSDLRIVYTEKFALSVAKKDVYRHNRNYNTVIVGGPGSRKTTGFVYPNLLEASCNPIILDPKGEVCRNTAKYLEQQGYTIKVLDLKNTERSWKYNPFKYIRPEHAEDDVQKIVTAIYKATTPPNSQTNDPFWDDAGKMLLSSLIYLLYYFGADNEKNFPFVLELIRAGRIENSEDDTIKSPLDILFESLEMQYPNHICIRCYKNASSGAGKTQQSIQIALLSRLQKFDVSSVAELMSDDELELEKLADEKVALYCIIPDNDSSYNFIVSLLYIQIFQVLYDIADNQYEGRLPRFIHFIMDEFANVHTPDDFTNILATCRSRNIGISIIIQNLSQLKSRYKDGWENIIGNCDIFFYLGGNEQSGHEYMSKALGTETIDTTNYGRQFGMHGNSSKNFQFKGRELLKPDEIRKMGYEDAILLIKGCPPLVDKKINVFKYKPAKGTAIRGNDKMKYDIPLRTMRVAVATDEADTQIEKQKNAFELTATGTNVQKAHLELNILGASQNIYSEDVADFIDAYDVDFNEMSEYINSFNI